MATSKAMKGARVNDRASEPESPTAVNSATVVISTISSVVQSSLDEVTVTVVSLTSRAGALYGTETVTGTTCDSPGARTMVVGEPLRLLQSLSDSAVPIVKVSEAVPSLVTVM